MAYVILVFENEDIENIIYIDNIINQRGKSSIFY